MRVVFAHDHRFVRLNGSVFSPGKLPYGSLSRYLSAFEAVVVAARVIDACSEQGIVNLNEASGPGISFVKVPNVRNLQSFWSSRREAKRILKAVVSESDAVIARLPSETGSIAAACAMELGKPWAAEVVGCARDALKTHGSVLGKLYAEIAFSRTRNLVRQATHAIYVTERFLQQRYPCNGRTESCSNVDLPDVDRAVLEARRARIFGCEQRSFILGMAGSLDVDYKGVDLAIRALPSLLSTGLDVSLQIAGPGDSLRWSKLAEDLHVRGHVHFLGQVRGGDGMRAWLDSIDCFLQPSRTEGLPRTLVEAMSRACPAIGSDAGGIPELLEQNFVFPRNDWRRLAELIRMLLGSAALRWDQARRNFFRSEDFCFRKLSRIREGFWKEFASYCTELESKT